MLKITFAATAIPDKNALIITVAAQNKLGEQGAKLDHKTGGAIKRAMEAAHFTGANGANIDDSGASKTRLSRLGSGRYRRRRKAERRFPAHRRRGGRGVDRQGCAGDIPGRPHKGLKLPSGRSCRASRLWARACVPIASTNTTPN